MFTRELDGHLLTETLSGDHEFYVVDGNKVDKGFKNLGSCTFIDGKFAFSGYRDNKMIIVYDGKEVGFASSDESGPHNVKEQLAYVSLNSDGTSQLVIGGKAVGPIMSDQIYNVDVSDGGKLVIQEVDRVEKDKKSVIYLDGKEVYRGDSGNPFGFSGEKLIFYIEENKKPALWYDGKKIDLSFYDNFDYIVVGNKLNIVATRNSENFLITEE